MAFCTICGKQLADGEVCTCQQYNAQSAPQGVPQGNIPQGMPYAQPQQAAPRKSVDMGGAFSKAFNHIKNTIRKPLTAAEEYYENGTIPSSAVLIGMITVMYVIATVLNLVSRILYTLSAARKVAKPYYKLLGISYGDYLELADTSRWEILNSAGIKAGTIVQSVFFPIIYIVLMGAAVFGLVFLIDAVVLKRKTDVNKIASLCGAVSVPLLAATVIRVISNFINVKVLNNMLFPIFIICMSVLVAIQGFTILSKEINDRKKLLISLAILVAGLVIVEFLIGLFLYKCTVFFALPGVPFI